MQIKWDSFNVVDSATMNAVSGSHHFLRTDGTEVELIQWHEEPFQLTDQQQQNYSI